MYDCRMLDSRLRGNDGGVGMTGEGAGVNWMEGYSGCGGAFGWGVLYLW